MGLNCPLSSNGFTTTGFTRSNDLEVFDLEQLEIKTDLWNIPSLDELAQRGWAIAIKPDQF